MLNTYTVTFIGHRYIENFSAVGNQLDNLIRSLLHKYEYVEFLVGRDGDFDQIASSAVLKVRKGIGDDNSSLVWVMPYESAEYRLNKKSFDEYYSEIEICDNSAQAHYKAAIQIRNQCMVDRANLIICYVSHKSGGAYQTVKYAREHNKEIINLANGVNGD
jgi:hypothetical protein